MKELIKNHDEVVEYLKEFPSPKVRVVCTVKNGYVSCVKPVKTIFGPELHVNKDTHKYLMEML